MVTESHKKGTKSCKVAHEYNNGHKICLSKQKHFFPKIVQLHMNTIMVANQIMTQPIVAHEYNYDH